MRKFSSLFVHPESRNPLAFFGTVAGDKVPQYILAEEQGWEDEVGKMLEMYQGESWVEKDWQNGFLFSLQDPEMYPVIGNIPVFAIFFCQPKLPARTHTVCL